MAKQKYLNKGATGWAKPDHPLVAGWTVKGKLMSDDDFAKEVDAMNRVYALILDPADQTTRDGLHASRDPAIVEPLRTTDVAVLFEPRDRERLAMLLLEAETVLEGTKRLVALRRWQLDHDVPPPDLATMVQAAGVTEIPTDPYSDRPMRMTTVDQQPLIYSVGLDGKDDRGLVEWKRARASGWNLSTKDPTGDLLLRLPVPQ